MDNIAIVDLAKIRGKVGLLDKVSGNPDWVAAAEKIRDGLGGIGFLYLVNHGIPEETIENAFAESKKFFDLSSDTKLKSKKDTRSADNGEFDLTKYSGYMPLGGETLNAYAKYEIKETYDWLNKKYSIPTSPETLDLHNAIIDLHTESKLLYRRILKLLAISLKVDENFFLKECPHFDDEENYFGLENIRLLHYPAIPEGEEVKPGTVRCGEHSDCGFLTMLFQDDVGGLEVKTVDGKWVEAKPIAGSVLINTGDLTEFWTSGIFPATKHRIVVPDVNDPKRKKERYSIAAFNGPESNALIIPMDLEKRPAEQERLSMNGVIYENKPISAYEYMMKLVAKQYQQS